MTALFEHKQSPQGDTEPPEAGPLAPDSGSLFGANFLVEIDEGRRVPSSFPTNARKPPSCRQLLLEFPPDWGDTPATQNNVPSEPKGDRYVQDDCPRTSKATPGDTQPTPNESDAALDAGSLRQGAEGQPRDLEGPPLPGEAGERPEPDRERSPGDRPQGTGGLFGLGV